MADLPRVRAAEDDPDGTPEYFVRASPPSPRSVSIWAETARRLGVSDG